MRPSQRLVRRGAVAVLNLSGCSGISDAGGANLIQLLSDHPTLRSISLSAVRAIGDLTLKQVARSMDHGLAKIQLRCATLPPQRHPAAHPLFPCSPHTHT